MSILAGGWVEAKTDDEWGGVIKVDDVINQTYDAFGCLFGVRNYTGLTPVVPLRGLPTDLSPEGTQYGLTETGDNFYQTWASWAELKGMDLDEVGVDERAYRYKRASDGSLIYQNSKSWGMKMPDVLYPGLIWEQEDSDSVYKIQTITRREIFELAPGWQMVFDMMRILERSWVDTDIRLVMWFW